MVFEAGSGWKRKRTTGLEMFGYKSRAELKETGEERRWFAYLGSDGARSLDILHKVGPDSYWLQFI